MTTETMTLAELRKMAGLSQSQMAAKMQVSRVQVSRIEAMYPDVMFKTLRAYMDALDANIRFTLDDVVDVESSEVVADTTRIYAENRRKDKSRAGALEKRTGVASR